MPANVRGGDEELQAAWQDFGHPRGYEEPGEQERQDLEDARNRGRGENARRKRLKRCWQQLATQLAAASMRAVLNG